MRKINRLIIHHTGQDGVKKENITPKMVENWHKDRFAAEFALYRVKPGIQYHYLIDFKGEVKNTHPAESVSWHCRNFNNDSIGVCVCGNYDWEVPTNNSLWTLVDVLAKLCRKFNLDTSRIFLHKDLAPTSCPGKALSEKLWWLKGAVEAKLKEKRGLLQRISEVFHP